MADTFTKAERSRIMAAVKGRDTTPELIVRRLVHSLGFRYRLHVHSLPGNPDMVFPRLRKIINVSGCFWHLYTDLSPRREAEQLRHLRFTQSVSAFIRQQIAFRQRLHR